MEIPDLADILRECHVAPEHGTKLLDAGWTTALIASAASSQDTFEAQLPEILEQGPGLVGPLQFVGPSVASCAHKSAAEPSASAKLAAPSVVPADSRVETSAPKLTTDVVAQMINKFKQHYDYRW